MMITRATRHDRADLEELYKAHDWHDIDLSRGTSFIARDGRIAATVRLVEVAPQVLVVDGVLVREDRRGEGLGEAVMQAAMNSRGGKLYLCTHEETIHFYERLGFAQLPQDELPEPVRDYLDKTGDLNTDPGHIHYFLTAR